MGQMEIAVKVGAVNWIEEGTAVAGWYTCILTGKKFRSAGAEAQFALQAELIEAAEAAQAAQEYYAEIASGGEEPEVVEANEQALDGQADREDIDFNKVDLDGLTANEAERLAEDLNVLNRPQYDHLTQRQSNMSGKLWDHIHSEAAFVAAPDGVKLISIDCCDCGVERKIKPQDAFQVKRCAICQNKHRNAVRAEKRKAKRAEAKQGE